jgi:hypothetical protein
MMCQAWENGISPTEFKKCKKSDLMEELNSKGSLN